MITPFYRIKRVSQKYKRADESSARLSLERSETCYTRQQAYASLLC